MNPIDRIFAWLLLCIAGGAAQAAGLPAGVGGNYYNPAQSGHGVTVEVLDEQRAIVHWQVYDHAGNPMPLYMDGRIEGNRILGSAYAPRGMRFGEFSRASLQVPYWGELELVFQSCASATLRWSSPTGFGAGDTPLQRLAYTAACPGGVLLPLGRVSGRVDYPPWGQGDIIGAVLADGSLHATLGPHFPFDATTRVLGAGPGSGTPQLVLSPAQIYSNGFLCRLMDPDCAPAPPQSLLLPFEHADDGVHARIPSDGSLLRARVHPGPLSIAEPIGGVFHFDTEPRDLGRWQLVLGPNEAMCIRAVGAATCLYAGHARQTNYGLHTFELQRVGGDEPAFTGYLLSDFTQVFIGPFDLHVVGNNGVTGLAFHARYDYRR